PRPKRRRGRAWTGAAPDGTPVVRLDIYASSEGVGARPAPAPVGGVAATTELERRRREVEQGEAALAARTRALDEREQASSRREAEARAGTARLETAVRELDERERVLAKREAEVRGGAATRDSRLRELVEREHALAEREQQLATREVELDRNAEVDNADIERGRRRLAAQEEALSVRTHELQRLEQQVEERERILAEREAQVTVNID